MNSADVLMNQNTGTILINDPKILWAAQLTRRPVDEILKKIDGSAVEFVDFSSSSDELKLSVDDKEISGSHKEELDKNLSIVGRLDLVSFSHHSGAVICDGERYSVKWDEKIRTKIQKFGDIDGVVFKVKPIIDRKRLEGELAIGFHILDCYDPQYKIFP